LRVTHSEHCRLSGSHSGLPASLQSALDKQPTQMPVIVSQIGESPGQSPFVLHAASHLFSRGKHVLPAPQSADARHSSHLPSTQNADPPPHIESAEHCMHPSDSLHPAAHFVPPNVQSLSSDEPPVFDPELHAAARTPATMNVVTAAIHRLVDWINMSSVSGKGEKEDGSGS